MCNVNISAGAIAIVEERARQITVEGFSATHDDRHTKTELVFAAVAYALYATDTSAGVAAKYWPWDIEDWNPDVNDQVRNLVKAGALIAAEIDRLERLRY